MLNSCRMVRGVCTSLEVSWSFSLKTIALTGKRPKCVRRAGAEWKQMIISNADKIYKSLLHLRYWELRFKRSVRQK